MWQCNSDSAKQQIIKLRSVSISDLNVDWKEFNWKFGGGFRKKRTFPCLNFIHYIQTPKLTCLLPKNQVCPFCSHLPLPELQLYERHFFFSVSVLSKNKVINLQVVKPTAGMTGPDAVRWPLTLWCDCLPRYWQDRGRTRLFLRILFHPVWRDCGQTRLFLSYSSVWQQVKNGRKRQQVSVSFGQLCSQISDREWAPEWMLEASKRCRHANVAKT